VDARYAHLLKLTIAGLNAFAMHAEESLFYRSIWLHISPVNRNHLDTVARIELMAQQFTHVATITKQYGTKW
jgi:hypothetical protein